MKPDRLKVHLDAAYRVAQAITLDARAAAELVERAFRQSHAEGSESWPDDEVRERLIRNVIAANRSSRSFPELPPTGGAGAAPDSGFQEQVVRETVDRLLPAALAVLPDRLRTLIVLIETENLSVADAARIFDQEADAVQHDLASARHLLREALLRSADPAERSALAAPWPSQWLREALVRHARTRFGPPPPTLVLPEPPRPAASLPATARAPRASENPSRAVSTRPRRLLVAVLSIVGAGLVGYVASAVLESPPDANIVTISAARMSSVDIDLPTTSAAEIESYLYDHAARPVRVPQIEQASLLGAGMTEVVEGVHIPVLLYDDEASGDQVPVFVYSYALLDRHADQLRLERDVMQQIEDERHFDLHDLGDTRILIWRSRDEIFVAATHGDASSLQDRIRPAS